MNSDGVCIVHKSARLLHIRYQAIVDSQTVQDANFFISKLWFVPGVRLQYLQEHQISPGKILLHRVGVQHLPLQCLLDLVIAIMPLALAAS